MTTIWVAFILSLLVGVVSTRLVIDLAWRLGIVDRPDGYRRIHKRDTPRLGGIAIYVAFAAPILALFLFRELSTVSWILVAHGRELAGLLVGATLALVLGIVDDVFEIRAAWKLVWQILIGSVAFCFGFSIHAVSNPLGQPFYLGIFAFPLTVFWFVGCMNAVNLLDGLDGLAAGMCLFVSMTLFLVSLQSNNILGLFLMGCLSGAILGFLIFNFPPARIFLGDSGSMLLGFLVAALSLVGASRKAEAAVALFIPVIALGLPILDTSIAIMRRWYKRLPVSTPDRQHIHHVLVAMGYSQQRVVLTLYVICVVLGGAALLITSARNEVVLLVIGSLAVTSFVCMRVFSGVRLRDVMAKLSEDGMRRQRSSEAKIIVEKAMHSMREAGGIEGLWHVCRQAFEDMALSSAELSVRGAEVEEWQTWRWESDRERGAPEKDAGPDIWSARLALRSGDRVLGQLVVGKHLGVSFSIPETPELLDRLRCELETQVQRLCGPAWSAAGEAKDG